VCGDSCFAPLRPAPSDSPLSRSESTLTDELRAGFRGLRVCTDKPSEKKVCWQTLAEERTEISRNCPPLSPLESALTKLAPVTPLESALTKKAGVDVYYVNHGTDDGSVFPGSIATEGSLPSCDDHAHLGRKQRVEGPLFPGHERSSCPNLATAPGSLPSA